MSLFKRNRAEATIRTEVAWEDQIPKKSSQFWEIEKDLREYLLEELKKFPGKNKEEEKSKVVELGELYFDKEGGRLTFEEKQELLDYVADELLAYGPITPLLENPHVSEVMVNSPTEIYYEKKGKILKSSSTFVDEQHVMRVIERIVAPIGRRVDVTSPMVDARLPDGSDRKSTRLNSSHH